MHKKRDEERASRYLAFFDAFLRIDGEQPFNLHDFQETLIDAVFGWNDAGTGQRLIREVWFEGPSGIGKTPIMAGLALGMLYMHNIGASGRPMPVNIYMAGASRNQARKCFDEAAMMVEASPELDELFEIKHTGNLIVWRDDWRRFIKALSGDATFEDGLKADGVFIDEYHRWTTEKARKLAAVLDKGLRKRPESLGWKSTTPGVIGESVLAEEEHDYAQNVLKGIVDDPSYHAKILTVPEKYDWDFEGEPAKKGRPPTGWHCANPGLGRLGVDKGAYQDIEIFRKAVRKAKSNPRLQAEVEQFGLGRWVQEVGSWMPLSVWDACKKPLALDDLKGLKCYLGMDLSTSRDFTALLLIFPLESGENYWLPFFWLPKDTLAERERRDAQPIRKWASVPAYNLELTDGAAVSQAAVERRILGCDKTGLVGLRDLYDIQEIAHDRWEAAYIATRLADQGLTMVPMRQGYNLSSSIKDMEVQMIEEPPRIRHDGNPIMRWMLTCCRVKQSPDEKVQFVKPDRRKDTKRIDIWSAGAMANDRLIRHQHDQSSRYDEGGEVIAF